MNLQDFPEEIKNDIEDQSLDVLENIKDEIVVIGGWAVRALLGKDHKRYTLDVDGVTTKDKFEIITTKLGKFDLKPEEVEWGIKYFKKYEPRVKIPEEIKSNIELVELRIEISEPVIKEMDTHHYFEFSLINYVQRNIEYKNEPKTISVKVPPIEHITANKMGLPVDYKNNYDVAALLRESDIDEVIKSIRDNDDWAELVLRRLPKSMGRINEPGRPEYILAVNSEIDIKEHIKKLKLIGQRLQ
jgi:hypothetical protein